MAPSAAWPEQRSAGKQVCPLARPGAETPLLARPEAVVVASLSALAEVCLVAEAPGAQMV